MGPPCYFQSYQHEMCGFGKNDNISFWVSVSSPEKRRCYRSDRVLVLGLHPWSILHKQSTVAEGKGRNRIRWISLRPNFGTKL